MRLTKQHRSIPFLFLFFICAQPLLAQPNVDYLLPIDTKDRQSWAAIALTPIGQFGVLRKARPNVPAHLHTGVDIKRPSTNYFDEYIFPINPGRVISMRDDGPYAQIIIEHRSGNKDPIWSVYEHVSDIQVTIGDTVTPFEPIARFMNKPELDQYGWQFDHLHFEILKHKPRPLKPKTTTPFRLFGTYSLRCYTKMDLDKYYHDPGNYFNYFSKNTQK